MKRVYLVGGRCHGKIVNVKHGSKVLIPYLRSLPDDVLQDPGPQAYLRFEIYERPDHPVVINDTERWLLVKQTSP
mgnify:FL=1